MESRVDNLIMSEQLPNESSPMIGHNETTPEVAPPEHIDSSESYNLESSTDTPYQENTTPEIQQDIDDYGNEIPKQEKVYTQSQVEAMIRDRVSRMKNKDAESFNTNSQVPQETSHAFEQQYDPSSTDNWEVQLEQFIDSTLAKREQKIAQENWRRQEQENQAQFEMKFNSGAAKYTDFEQVVAGKPLTPQMVLATRGMQDPAAFIYAASKTQTQELDRISKIYDPMTQAVELGKLEERMRKARSQTSSAPKPIGEPRGDVADKTQRTRNIDDKIRQDEMNTRKLRASR